MQRSNGLICYALFLGIAVLTKENVASLRRRSPARHNQSQSLTTKVLQLLLDRHNFHGYLTLSFYAL